MCRKKIRFIGERWQSYRYLILELFQFPTFGQSLNRSSNERYGKDFYLTPNGVQLTCRNATRESSRILAAEVLNQNKERNVCSSLASNISLRFIERCLLVLLFLSDSGIGCAPAGEDRKQRREHSIRARNKKLNSKENRA